MAAETNFETALIINAKFPSSVCEFKCLIAVNFNSPKRFQLRRTHQINTVTIIWHYQTLGWWNFNKIQTLIVTLLSYNYKVQPTKLIFK